jgi:ankyrin repeat protein
LYFAANAGSLKAAQQLFLDGADVNALTRFGQTPLYAAAYKGHIDMARLLVRYGADSKMKCNAGYIPIQATTIEGNSATTEMIEFLSSLA